MEPGEFTQSNLFNTLGPGVMTMEASIEVTVISGGPVAIYASEIDNLTQDPILVPAMK